MRAYCDLMQDMYMYAEKNKPIKGSDLNKTLDGMPMLKFMNDNEVHFGMKYKTGKNHDILPLDSKECSCGGIYVTPLINYDYWRSYYGIYARRVRIESDASIYVEKYKLKSDKINLEEKMLKKPLLKQLFKEYIDSSEKAYNIIHTHVISNPRSIKYIEPSEKNYPIILQGLSKDGSLLRHIDPSKRTIEMMLVAVRENAYVIQLIESSKLTPEIIIQGVKQDANILIFIDPKQRTHQILINAVEQNGHILKIISRSQRTPDIILRAVRQNYYAMQYIDESEMTPEIRKAGEKYLKYMNNYKNQNADVYGFIDY